MHTNEYIYKRRLENSLKKKKKKKNSYKTEKTTTKTFKVAEESNYQN